MSVVLPDTFLAGLHQLNVGLNDRQRGQFLRYRQELLDWNTRFNLTAITDPEEVLLKHFLDFCPCCSFTISRKLACSISGQAQVSPGFR